LEGASEMLEKGILLLSGGFDSVVAGKLMKNRVEIIAVHFHQQPLTDEKEVEKVKELAKVLEIEKVYLVPFTDVLKALVEKCDHKNYFVLSKIAMFQAAELIAEKENAKYLITGENLGQVSSQTLSNLNAITKNIKLEIFRPVLTRDKQEIINMAKKMGTYDISKGPELCSLLGPKHPATKSDPAVVEKELQKLELKKMLEDSIGKAEVV
jgi:tRNA uracil 4-sulfurtransferase